MWDKQQVPHGQPTLKLKSKQRMKNIKSHLNHGFQCYSQKKKKKKVGGGYQGPLDKWLILGLGAENTQANIQKPNVSL